jgi:hypothetical protein
MLLAIELLGAVEVAVPLQHHRLGNPNPSQKRVGAVALPVDLFELAIGRLEIVGLGLGFAEGPELVERSDVGRLDLERDDQALCRSPHVAGHAGDDSPLLVELGALGGIALPHRLLSQGLGQGLSSLPILELEVVLEESLVSGQAFGVDRQRALVVVDCALGLLEVLGVDAADLGKDPGPFLVVLPQLDLELEGLDDPGPVLAAAIQIAQPVDRRKAGG